ncbi:hypothetical protein EDB19DRAFT_1836334 [Suillus lakei]|nr:hypothetical protein EDB19DRAFT_1836334 [Suillus lakei]
MSPSMISKAATAVKPSTTLPFSIHNIGALYCSGFAEGFSNSKQQAAARALLWHDAHLDGTHYHTRRPNGLHPLYAAFNSFIKTKECSISRDEFVEVSLRDLFDSIEHEPCQITIQDHLDGSISLLLRCPGFKAETALSPEDITVDLYVTPWEACESSERIGGDIAVLTQAFCEEFVIPHIEHFMKCCHIEEVEPPHHYSSTQISLKGPPYLPGPVVATGVQIQCSGCPIASFQRELSSASKIQSASCWEENLRSPKWKLDYEQASKLTGALQADLQVITPVILRAIMIAVDDTAVKLAADHKKSIHRVQNNLHMGHSLLQSKHLKVSAWNAFIWRKHQDGNKENGASGKDVLEGIMKDYKDEYYSLTDKEKSSLITEYKERKVMKTTGHHISTKSKINDVTWSLKAVENELNNLRSRTGVETILYMTQGTTDLPLCGVMFVMEGMHDFMESVIGIDNQDFAQRRTTSKKVTGNPKATMQWTHFFCNIVKCYSVVVEGWPEQIPFVNLSTASSSLTDLEMLLQKWHSGLISWKHITPEQLEDIEKDRDEDLENSTIVEKHWHVRSDKGKKRCRDSDDNAQHCKKMHKSAETVPSDSKEDATDAPPSIPINNSNLHSTLLVPNAPLSIPIDNSLRSTSLVPNAPLSIPIDNSLHSTSTSLIPNVPLSIPIDNNIPPVPPTPLLTPNTESLSPFSLPDHNVDISMLEFPQGFDEFLAQFEMSIPSA